MSDVLLAFAISPRQRRVSVSGRVCFPWRQAAVTLPRYLGEFGIDRFQIAEHYAYRIVQAIKVQTIERGALRIGLRRIVLVQPIDEGARFLIPPHPSRKARKGRPFLTLGFAVAHIMVDTRGIRPISFGCDDAEAFLLDQPPRDPRTHPVELRCAVARLADENHSGVANSAQ